MKTIFRIARVELSALFFSPVAWLVLIIFTFQCGLSFTDAIRGPLIAQDSGFPQGGLTFNIFQHPIWGFFKAVTNTLYLYIPLLTMGLLSREISSGSIKLLLASPVKISEIVAGKFLAMMIYSFVLILALLLVVCCGGISIAHMDFKVLLSGLLGIYLLICTYSAIGLFMSSLTSYQVVAAMGTLAVLAALNYVRQMGQSNDIFRNISYFLSLAGRVDQFVFGLLTTKGVLYFILVSAFFLALTVMKLNDGRTTRSALVKTGRYVLLATIVVIIGYISSIPALTGYYDMTINKALTLTPGSQQIVARLKQPVKVTAYINLLDNRINVISPETKNDDRDFWQLYSRFMPEMKLDYRFYYDTTTDEFLYKFNKGVSLKDLGKKLVDAYGWSMNMFLKPEQVRSQIDLEPEEHRGVRLVEAGGRKTFLRLYDELNPQPTEAEITASLKRLLVKPPKIAFLAGQYERDITRIGKSSCKQGTTSLVTRAALINQGFDVVSISSLEGQDIPSDITALAIIDPRTAFKPVEIEKIKKYLSGGGNMLIAGEPGKQYVLNPLLSMLGVRMLDGVLIEYSTDFSPDYIQARFTPTAGKISYKLDPFSKDSTKVFMQGATGLEYKDTAGFTVNPLVVTNEKNTWNKMGAFAMDTGKVTYNPEHGDVKKPIVTALSLTRNVGDHQQRILVTSDADWFSNDFYPVPIPYTGNFFLGQEAFRWLDHEEFPIDVNRPETRDSKLSISQDDLKIIRVIFLGVIPGIILILGVILLIRRKRK